MSLSLAQVGIEWVGQSASTSEMFTRLTSDTPIHEVDYQEIGTCVLPSSSYAGWES